MSAEQIIVELLASCQSAWLEQFPSLHRRAQWHIVYHLCTKSRAGASMGELHGLVKQVFLLDDGTVKERVFELIREGLCTTDHPSQPLSARIVVAPTEKMLDSFDLYVDTLGSAFAKTIATLDGQVRRNAGPVAEANRASTLVRYDHLRDVWSVALEAVLGPLRLSPSRRFEARRHLLSMSHGTIVLDVLGDAVRRPVEHIASGVLADLLAARLLPITGQNFHTTRDHIAYLLDAGLLERRSGKSLRVGLSQAAIDEFCVWLRKAAAMLSAASTPPLDNPPAFTVQSPALSGMAETAPFDHVYGSDACDETIRLPASALATAAVLHELHVKVVRPPAARRLVTIRAEPVIVGRAVTCSVILDAPEVSRMHCRIEAVDGNAVVTDLGSRNGTFVNGARIEAPTPVSVHDEFEIGGFCLTCKVIDAAVKSDDTLGTGQRAGVLRKRERNRIPPE